MTVDGPAMPDDSANSDTPSSQLPSRQESSLNKAETTNRNPGQTSDVFSKSLSRLTNRRSKDSTGAMPHASDNPTGSFDRTAEGSNLEDEKKSFFRKEKKQDKSKGRTGKGSGSSAKAKDEKPERECVVM